MTPTEERCDVVLLERAEEYTAGRDRRLVVMRFASRWFVLEGFAVAPLSTYVVHGPYHRHEHASRAARAMHARISARERLRMRIVGENG